MTNESDLLDALKLYRDREFGTIVTVMVGIAAETHPDLLRAALGNVFDLRAVEADGRRVVAVLHEIRRQGEEAREVLRSVYRGLDLIESRLDGLEYRAEQLERVNGKPQRETVQ